MFPSPEGEDNGPSHQPAPPGLEFEPLGWNGGEPEALGTVLSLIRTAQVRGPPTTGLTLARFC